MVVSDNSSEQEFRGRKKREMSKREKIKNELE
jgi:hypothetical protein